jgi:histidinol-phosphatase (PHP family)
MIADYHIHTHLCRHAEGEPREYVERAIALGMTEMGFADHLPFLAGWAPSHDVTDDWSMGLDELDDYVSVVHDLAREFTSDLHILVGIEADYIEETLAETAAVLEQYPFDYTIGSVHIVGGHFPFDHPDMLEQLPLYGIDRIYLESLALAERAAASGLFDIIGHLDHAKKFGHPPEDAEGVAAAASSALRAIKRAGSALELNTAGWRKPVGEAYPAPDLLAAAADLDIPLILGSDAHRPGEVGYEFGRAAAVAREAGYSAVLRLSDGRPRVLA